MFATINTFSRYFLAIISKMAKAQKKKKKKKV